MHIANRTNRWRLLVIAAIPVHVLRYRVSFRGPQQQVGCGQPRRSHDGHGAIHEIRIRKHPLESLHPAHRNAHHRVQMRNAQDVLHQMVFGRHHVANGEFRENHARLLRAIRRGRRHAIAERIHGNDEIARRIHQSIGGHVLGQIVASPRKPRRKQHRVGFVGVQLSERAITNSAVSHQSPLSSFRSPIDAVCNGASAANAAGSRRRSRTLRMV